MNKILSLIDAKCPQSLYKSIINDIEKIEKQFNTMQTNKYRNLKLKEQFKLLVSTLQSPNRSVNIEKTTDQINTILGYFRNNANNNLSELESEIKKLCIKIGSFMTNFKIREKREELMKLKNKELELIEILMELIDNEVEKNSQNTDPLSKKVLQKNVNNLQSLLSEIKDENDSHLLTKVNDVIKDIDYDNIKNVQNVDQKIETLRSKIEQLDEYEQEKKQVKEQIKQEQNISDKSKTQKKDILKTISKKMHQIDQHSIADEHSKSKSKQDTRQWSRSSNNSKKVSKPESNIGQQTKQELNQVDNWRSTFDKENARNSSKLSKKIQKLDSSVKDQKKEINNTVENLKNHDKKIKIGQMANLTRTKLKQELDEEKDINKLFDKAAPYSKSFKKNNSLQSILKKADREFGNKKTKQKTTKPKTE